ncbi:MAG: bifunctional metallophosphatase/5'-nucleotidase, partial [Clostridia bacterium]|nr:bifunctional metallophosphatase/5'-nucleotidase [Deltaproteobacteria bacterium]
MKTFVAVLAFVLVACTENKAPEVSAFSVAPEDLCMTLLGTNDIHGTVESRIHGEPPISVREGGLPLLSAYITGVRTSALNPVLLLDAGDMYRGSFASDRFEGKPTIDAMNIIGYDAGVLGNHEFDFGSGETGTDKLSVVRQRVADAKFPILTANVYDRATGKRIDWPNTQSSILKRIGAMDVGIIGISTVDTPSTTFASNVTALEFKDPAPIVQAEAAELRNKGARLVVLVGHVGTECASADSCDKDSELVKLLTTLPARTVDAVVAGHTHRDVANWIAGVPVIESSSYGRKLGRVDLCAKAEGGLDANRSTIHQPTRLCETAWTDNTCEDPADAAQTPHPVKL